MVDPRLRDRFFPRKVADWYAAIWMGGSRLAEVHPGVFVNPDAEHEALVVLGYAPVSEPAIRALKASLRVWTFLAVTVKGERDIEMIGPSKVCTDAIWADETAYAIDRTRRAGCYLTTVEIVHASERRELSELAFASEIIGSVLPFQFKRMNCIAFRNLLEREVSLEIEEADDVEDAIDDIFFSHDADDDDDSDDDDAEELEAA